jgi:hypothetical protein
MCSARINGIIRLATRTRCSEPPPNSPSTFQKAYGYEAPDQAAQSAAAVHIFADAFKRAQSLEPEKVRDALAKTELETFYGPIKFSEDSRNVAKPMVLTQVINGEYVVVEPVKWAKAKPVIPRRISSRCRRATFLGGSAAAKARRRRTPSARKASTPS